MMYDWSNRGMGGYGLFALLIWLVAFTDLVLLGIWLWQKIQKNK